MEKSEVANTQHTSGCEGKYSSFTGLMAVRTHLQSPQPLPQKLPARNPALRGSAALMLVLLLNVFPALTCLRIHSMEMIITVCSLSCCLESLRPGPAKATSPFLT